MTVLIIVAAVAVFTLWGCWRAVCRAIGNHGIHVLAWRYATGAHMAAGGSHVCQPGQSCPAGRWSHMRRHRRAAVRLAGAVFVLGCGWGALTDRGALAAALIVTAVGTGALFGLLAWWRTGGRRIAGRLARIALARAARMVREHRRAAIATAAAGFTAGCGYGLLTSPGALAAALIITAAAGIAGAGIWVWWRTGEPGHKRVIVRPMAAALARTLAIAETDAQRMIRLPAAGMRQARGELGAITLPEWYAASPDQRKTVDQLITSHLPVDVDTTWRIAGAPKRVIISAAPSPPDVVPFAQVRGQIERLRPGQVLLGLDRRHEPYLGDFNGGDDPHWGFSVGSGRGKSTQLCSIGAQILHQDPGASMLGIDPKMTSFEVLAGVPGVELANDPRDMTGGGGVAMAEYPDIPRLWQAIRGYRVMMDNRISAKHADPTLEFPVSLLFLDELNMFSAMSAGWWKAQGQKGTPDIWMDIAAVFWMGRFVHCHGVAVGQRLDDKATGGIGLRDSLGLRGLAGFRPNQWKMLIGTTPIPKSQKPRGRWIYSDGQDETWVQNVYGAPQEIRDWAMAGRDAGDAGASVSASLTGTSAPDPDGHEPLTGVVWLVGIKAAADYLGMSPAAFEKARQRRPVDREIRKGNQPAWSADDLDGWAANRPRAGVM